MTFERKINAKPTPLKLLHPSKQQEPKGLAHRADIQSLRALAIGLVIASHAHLPLFIGGYVGVDVFFVLSGYLISGLILHEVESTGRFDVWLFYTRRLKRLLPAMLFMLFCIAMLAWVLTGPQQQKSGAAAGQSATLWLSNFYFSTRTISYFSSDLDSNLFLHTWSLAVEEQFYLVWPWLLLFLYGVWKWQGTPMSRERLTHGLIMVATTSILVGLYLSSADVEAGFYLMPGRAWEFALGTLTFLLRQATETERFAWLDKYRGRSLVNTIGFLAILLATLLYNNDLRYPGLWALLPCLGTALILFDAPEKNPTSMLSRLVLNQSLLQFVGNTSYSLYLWHWPILILGTPVFGSSVLMQLSLVAIATCLATVTYYVVENPIHQKPLRNTSKILIPSAMGMALGFFAMGAWQNAADKLQIEKGQAHIQSSRSDVPAIYKDFQDCDSWYSRAEISVCVYGSANARHTVVMFGDSLLAQWVPAVEEIYLRKPDWRLIVLTKSACPASQVSYYYERIKAMYSVCDLWRERALNHIVKLHPDVVIMGSSHYGFSSQQWIDGTRKVLDRLYPVAVAIISPTPRLGFDGPNCLSAKINLPYWLPLPIQCEATLKTPSDQSIIANLRLAAQSYSNVRVIDLTDEVCPNGVCRAQIGATIVYRDELHLTASFVRSLAPAFQRNLQ